MKNVYVTTHKIYCEGHEYHFVRANKTMDEAIKDAVKDAYTASIGYEKLGAPSASNIVQAFDYDDGKSVSVQLFNETTNSIIEELFIEITELRE